MANLPAAFVRKYEHLLGARSAEFFAALAEQPKKAFRLNTLKSDFAKVQYPLTEPVPEVPHAYYGSVAGKDVEWTAGIVYSQDPAAMYPALAAQVKPGEKVLDLCAAPGGKTTALAQSLAGQGLLVANEISKARAKILRENLERWGVTNALITSASPDQLAPNFPHFFDKILVDAPCSGEAMFRKDPAAADYWSPAYVETCQLRQEQILAQAVQMLAPNGELIYATCSFSPEEDEQIVEYLVEQYQLDVEDLDLAIGQPGRSEWTKHRIAAVTKSRRFWPDEGIGEGQFLAKLKKPGTQQDLPATQEAKLTKPSKKEQELINEVLSQFKLPSELESGQISVSNGHVFIPAYTGKLTKVQVLTNGVELGLLKKNRFEPSQQLAQVLACSTQTRKVDLDQQQYQQYLHGEMVKVQTDQQPGFILVNHHDFIFSFGKLTADGKLKNFYPKGLRQ